MQKILVIKTEASGDVVRTTVLLNALNADIFWITSSYNLPLFPDQHPVLKKVVAINNIPKEFYEINFDIIINLEESLNIASMLSSFKAKRLIGVYEEAGNLLYTPESSDWFDMSLISRLGKQQADILKLENKLTYQHFLFRMLGEEFRDEKYAIYKNERTIIKRNVLVGIEQHVGERWPNKKWMGYHELDEILRQEGIKTMFFKRRTKLRQYLDDISRSSVVVTGDTLAMHVALAYEIPCVAIFNCTSPKEIFGYGLLSKVVSPLLKEMYYSTSLVPEATNAIKASELLGCIKTAIKTNPDYVP